MIFTIIIFNSYADLCHILPVYSLMKRAIYLDYILMTSRSSHLTNYCLHSMALNMIPLEPNHFFTPEIHILGNFVTSFCLAPPCIIFKLLIYNYLKIKAPLAHSLIISVLNPLTIKGGLI